MNINKYKTIIFDCDGVLLNSNSVKTQAFYKATLPYGKQVAGLFIKYHINNGGVSRYRKFEYFFRHILKKDIDPGELKFVLDVFADEVNAGLLMCDITPGLYSFREAYRDPCWIIVSGGDQRELNEIFYKRNLIHYFDCGIFGSPDKKEVIISREIRNGNIKLPAVFLGDSEYDHKVAINAGLDFIFVSNWSEFENWEKYVEKNSIFVIPNIKDIFKKSIQHH